MKKKEINLLSPKEIKENLAFFESGYSRDAGRHPLERYASFDYCSNYFQGFKDKKELAQKDNIQNSCLHLGFYLASWGMYRGSTFLLQKSVKIFEPLIKYIASDECDVWGIDVDEYTDENINKLITCGERIVEELKIREKQKNTDTLVTKIMLGVFGNVPAFDSYFRSGSKLGTFNKFSLEEISSFYGKHSKTISDKATKIKTFEYHSGKASNRSYTKAKIIDMIFFIEGYKNVKKSEPKFISKTNIQSSKIDIFKKSQSKV